MAFSFAAAIILAAMEYSDACSNMTLVSRPNHVLPQKLSGENNRLNP